MRPIGTLVVALAIASAPVSCDRKSAGSATPKPDVTDPPTATQNASALSEPIEDRSLMDAEYIALGIPAPSRTWSGADMKSAATALSKLAQTDPGKLPRFKSPRSGGIFARMTDPANLKLHEMRDMPLQARANDLAEDYLGGVRAIAALYVNAAESHSVAYRDMLEVLGSMMYVAKSLGGLIEELAATLRPDDPKYEVRRGGLDQARSGLATMVAGALGSVGEQAVPAEDRIALIGHLSKTLPGVLPHLPPDSQKEVAVRLQSMAADAQLANLRPAITELSRLVLDSKK